LPHHHLGVERFAGEQTAALDHRLPDVHGGCSQHSAGGSGTSSTCMPPILSNSKNLRGAKKNNEQVEDLMASSEDNYARLVDALGLDDAQAEKLRRLQELSTGGDQSGGPT